MAALITKAQIRAYLPQLKAGTDIDDLLDDVCDRATAIVNRALYPVSFDGYAASTRRIYAYGTDTLLLPPHQLGQTISVLDPTGASVTGYTEGTDGHLYLPNAYMLNYRPYVGWGYTYYNVTANWGNGAAPDDLVEVTLEVAVNILREKDRGMFSDAIGVEAAGEVRVGYQGALTKRQAMIIDAIKVQYGNPVVV